MSATQFESVTLEDDIVVTRSKPGDFVVCNLSSINLGRAVPANVLDRLIKIQVRMLDNVIDLNKIPVVQAQRTNSRYRGIGLGTFGWHHLLALKNIQWESDEAVDYADKLYEKIAFLTIKASMELAKEKGAYPLFEGSDWQTGAYFEHKGYDSKEWRELRIDVATNGMRNGYLMAVAPNCFDVGHRWLDCLNRSNLQTVIIMRKRKITNCQLLRLILITTRMTSIDVLPISSINAGRSNKTQQDSAILTKRFLSISMCRTQSALRFCSTCISKHGNLA